MALPSISPKGWTENDTGRIGVFVMSVLVGLGSGSNYVSTPHQSKWITDSSYSIRSTLVSFLDPPPLSDSRPP